MFFKNQISLLPYFLFKKISKYLNYGIDNWNFYYVWAFVRIRPFFGTDQLQTKWKKVDTRLESLTLK